MYKLYKMNETTFLSYNLFTYVTIWKFIHDFYEYLIKNIENDFELLVFFLHKFESSRILSNLQNIFYVMKRDNLLKVTSIVL